MPGRPPAFRARPATLMQRMLLPTVVPSRSWSRPPRRRNRRHRRNRRRSRKQRLRRPPSRCCRPPAGPAAPRDGDGDRARRRASDSTQITSLGPNVGDGRRDGGSTAGLRQIRSVAPDVRTRISRTAYNRAVDEILSAPELDCRRGSGRSRTDSVVQAPAERVCHDSAIGESTAFGDRGGARRAAPASACLALPGGA